MGVIVDYLCYIIWLGIFEFEDDWGMVCEGKEVLCDLLDGWCYGGWFIVEVENWCEVVNLMFVLLKGNDVEGVRCVVCEFVKIELVGYCYVMVLYRY